MYFHALATDYDGTLADHGVVSSDTLAALDRLKATGRRLLLVTGRELRDLERVFPELGMFDKIVAENGGLLYTPVTQEERPLASAPPAAFVEQLRRRRVDPLSVGRTIVATWEPNETAVLEVIRDLGLELEIIFNKGAVMVLPTGVNKATGLKAALAELELSPQNVVGIGDAENDHAFLKALGCGVAVANALPMLKETADLVTARERGAGVAELIDRLIGEDGRLAPARRHSITIGNDSSDEPVLLPAHGGGVLIAGSSGIGKSTLATAMSERLIEQAFQFCIFDPEGDYRELENAVVVGNSETPPTLHEICDLMRLPSNNVVVNTLALDVTERPGFFAVLAPEVNALRSRTGRPHWIIIDEAHHLLPAAQDSEALSLPKEMPATVLITVHPESVSPDALAAVETVIALGPKADKAVAGFCAVIEEAPPAGLTAPSDDQVLFWRRTAGGPARLVTPIKPRQSRKRHARKYAEGQLGKDKSFYFRGPDGSLNLRAHNLMMFLQIADGIDDRTWEHHLRAGDYSTWLRDLIKDSGLADEVAAVEADGDLSPRESRKRIAEAVRRRYTVPAS